MFVAARSDGLGVRLNALFNAALAAQLTGGDFKFYWPKTFLSNDRFHSIESESDVFNKDFLAAHFLRESLPKELKVVKFSRRSPVGMAEFLKEQLSNGFCVMPQKSLLDNIIAAESTKRELAALAADRIVFSDKVLDAVSFAQKVEMPENVIGIHIRSGDIVYGRHKENPNFVDKVICGSAVVSLTRSLRSDDRDVILFGQESAAIEALCSRYGAISAERNYAQSNYSPLQRAFIDVCLMGRCSTLFAESSGLPRLAGQMGSVRLLSIFGFRPKVEWPKAIYESIDYSVGLFSADQVAYSYFIAAEYLLGAEVTNLSRCQRALLLRGAEEFNPNNRMFFFASVYAIASLGQYSQAENKLVQGVRGLVRANGVAVLADVMRVLSRKNLNSKGLAYGKYAVEIQKDLMSFAAGNEICPNLVALTNFLCGSGERSDCSDFESRLQMISSVGSEEDNISALAG
jgi:hypothetical protein